jgi:hypothetical protein
MAHGSEKITCDVARKAMTADRSAFFQRASSISGPSSASHPRLIFLSLITELDSLSEVPHDPKLSRPVAPPKSRKKCNECQIAEFHCNPVNVVRFKPQPLSRDFGPILESFFATVYVFIRKILQNACMIAPLIAERCRSEVASLWPSPARSERWRRRAVALTLACPWSDPGVSSTASGVSGTISARAEPSRSAGGIDWLRYTKRSGPR